jgi:hypothetical protein
VKWYACGGEIHQYGRVLLPAVDHGRNYGILHLPVAKGLLRGSRQGPDRGLDRFREVVIMRVPAG